MALLHEQLAPFSKHKGGVGPHARISRCNSAHADWYAEKLKGSLLRNFIQKNKEVKSCLPFKNDRKSSQYLVPLLLTHLYRMDSLTPLWTCLFPMYGVSG